MANHIKPTKEELKAKQEEALNATPDPKEEEETQEETEDTEVVEETPEETVEEVVEETPEIDEEEEPEEKEEQEEETVEEKADRLKKENAASARENQKILAKNRVINKALAETDEIPEPTDEELLVEAKKEGQDFEVMSDVERSLYKETVISRRFRGKIKEAQDQAKKIEKWQESVETYVEDPQTLIDIPELENKTEAFKEFALKDENNSIPFKLLVSAFLYQKSTEKKVNKGRMFETGSGGPNDAIKPKSDKLSLDESRKLRETDYSKWREMVRAGKIDMNV